MSGHLGDPSKATGAVQRLKEIKGDDENKEEPDSKEDDLTSSVCPSCGHGFDMALLLPCSHTICGRCLTKGAWSDEHKVRIRGVASPPVCAILCPRCHHGVELPCWEWASVTQCLPSDPTVILDPHLSQPAAGQGQEGEREEGSRLKDERMPGDEAQTCEGGAGWAWPVGVAVDLSEEEMEQSVHGLHFSLEPISSVPSLLFSNSGLTVTLGRHGNHAEGYDPCDPSHPLPEVCGGVVIHRGQYYWEVDVCNSALYRIGVSSLNGGRGWWLERSRSAFWAVYDGLREALPTIPPQLKTVGMFLNVGGFSITFHNPLTQELLAAIPSRLTPPLRPALQLGQGRLKLRPGLPPPNHVFLSRSSAYRGPGKLESGRWRQDVPFGLVRSVIQKFERLSTSDTDSGLTSSSSSSLASQGESTFCPDTALSAGEGAGATLCFPTQSGATAEPV